MSSHPIHPAPKALSDIVERRTRELSADAVLKHMSPADRHLLEGDVSLLVKGMSQRAVTSGNRVAIHAIFRIAPRSGVAASRDLPVLINWTHHAALRPGEHPDDVILDLDRITFYD